MCALLRRNIIGAKIVGVDIRNDPLLFPVLKNSKTPEKEMAELTKILDGAVVESVGRHGKYFWIRFDGNRVMLMHLGMTGMVYLKNIKSHLVFMENGGDKKVLKDKLEGESKSKYFKKEEKSDKDIEVKVEWPPRFSKMELKLSLGHDLDLSFSDARRLGRIRVFTGIKTDQDMFQMEPLNRQGPDYSKSGQTTTLFEFGDPDPVNYIPQFTQAEFNQLILQKRKPIKSLLLEQEYFAGVGNWVSDEILYQAQIHPQQVLSDKLTDTSPYLTKLFAAIKEICSIAVTTEGNVKQFPDHWLMLYRWGKRRKRQDLPKVNGQLVDFVTVGGRTLCFVPNVQRKL